MDQPVYSVSDLIREVKIGLEGMYANIPVQGELANVNCHSSGHCYATLKDKDAQISIVMFRDDLRRLKFRPENGLAVVVRGRLTLYPARGSFQMVLTQMTPVGKGDLHLAFEQLKARLEKEGLFSPDRKRPIPPFPSWIGVVTSKDGAALQDILSVLNRRYTNLRILICPVAVQGAGAAADIARGIDQLNRDYPELDVLLIGRGGGSLEDLWAFNEEPVARAIAASKIPTISCVGHETDFTIADFVADLRAPTPSAAAEIVIQAKSELVEQIRHLSSRLRTTITYRLQEVAQQLDLNRLTQALRLQMQTKTQDFRRLTEKLHLLSPLATLSRGFAVVRGGPANRILKNASDVKPSDPLEITLEKGRLFAQVQRTEI